MSVGLGKPLRRTLLSLLVLLFLCTVASWVRSYSHADRLHGRLWGRASFLVGHKQGQVVMVGFRSHGAPGWWKWELRSYGVDDELSFPVGDVAQYTGTFGVGWLQNPLYFVMRPVQTLPDGGEFHVFGAATASLSGQGLLVPHWMVAVTIALAVALVCFGRFSLRAFLIWLTVVALLLGVSVARERWHQDPEYTEQGRRVPPGSIPR